LDGFYDILLFFLRRAGAHIKACCSLNYKTFLFGLAIGLLLGGVALATALTMSLKSSESICQNLYKLL
jgi:hypothetical protein